MENKNYLWWQDGIIYQVYPRSFQDTDDDGIGDLKGIVQRLDYLQWLGVTVLWLSPIYPSPMKDYGYDIADYIGIHSIFGTMADFDALVAEVHQRGMKVIMDLVPNHSSDKHEWFKESRSSKDNSRRNWYIWRDAKPDGSPPNNWLAAFGGSAWEWDEHTRQYYYHAFLKEQPDLNYREPEVIEAMKGVMRFWLDKGVDGFRVDVMWHMIKDAEFRDNPANPNYKDHMPTCDAVLQVFSTDQPEVHDIVHQMRRVLDEYEDRMMIGEVYLPVDRLMTYYGVDNKGAQLPFNFLLLLAAWDAQAVGSIISQYLSALPRDAWPNWVLGNHDQPRIRGRVGLQQARIAAMLLLTLPGTPTMYYGDEIGMQDVPIPDEEIQDPQGLNMPGKNLSRDPSRTPMQWDASLNAGFTIGKPWLRVDKMYDRENVAVQKKDNESMLVFYRKLISLRQQEAALKTGDYKQVFNDRHALDYVREADGADSFMVVLNFTHRQCRVVLPDEYEGVIEVATASELEDEVIKGIVYLSGDEGIIVRLKK